MVTLEEVTLIRAPIERCFDLARSVEVHVAGNVHFGESALALSGVTTGLIGLGQRVTWQARHFGVRRRLTSEVTALDRPHHFRDVMVQGAFRCMEHDHFFRSRSPDETEMRDVFRFAAPFGILGLLAEYVLLRRYMRGLLHERNAALRDAAESNGWQRYLRP